MTKFRIQAHWSLVRTAKRGVQSMIVYYVDDKCCSTRQKDVYETLPKGIPMRVVKEACNDAATYGDFNDYHICLVDDKWIVTEERY